MSSNDRVLYDEILRSFRDVGIEIVHEHAESGFLRPAFAADRGTARRRNDARAHRHDRCSSNVENVSPVFGKIRR